MSDDVMYPMDRGYLEVARRLEAYTDLRLTPSAAATAGMRAIVMQAAQRRAGLIKADPTLVARPAVAVLAPERQRTARAHWRRPAAAMLAASLTVGIVAGTVSAANPGGPLYATRLWIEMANLPTDPVARADGELARLQDRLREAQQASSAGDAPATGVALAAYSAILLEAEQGSDGDAAASAAIEGGVARHVAVLTQLVDKVPANARGAIEHALTSSTKVLNDLHSRNSDRGGNGGGNGPGNGPGNGNTPGEHGSTGGPGPAGQPATGGPSAKPDQTSRPDATSRPARPHNSHPAKPGKTSASAKPAPGNGQGGQANSD